MVLDAPVAPSSLWRVVAGDRIRAAVALSDQHVRIGAEFDQRLSDRLCAPLRERDIEGLVASAVGIAG